MIGFLVLFFLSGLVMNSAALNVIAIANVSSPKCLYFICRGYRRWNVLCWWNGVHGDNFYSLSPIGILLCFTANMLTHRDNWILQGCCVNAPMITVADYSKGSEGYTYNYYVSYFFYFFVHVISLGLPYLKVGKKCIFLPGRCYSGACGWNCGDVEKRRGSTSMPLYHTKI